MVAPRGVPSLDARGHSRLRDLAEAVRAGTPDAVAAVAARHDVEVLAERGPSGAEP